MELALELVGIDVKVAPAAVLEERHSTAQVCQAIAALRKQLVRVTESGNVFHRRRKLGDLRLEDDVNERRKEIISTRIISCLVPALQQGSQGSVGLDNALQLATDGHTTQTTFSAGENTFCICCNCSFTLFITSSFFWHTSETSRFAIVRNCKSAIFASNSVSSFFISSLTAPSV